MEGFESTKMLGQLEGMRGPAVEGEGEERICHQWEGEGQYSSANIAGAEGHGLDGVLGRGAFGGEFGAGRARGGEGRGILGALRDLLDDLGPRK